MKKKQKTKKKECLWGVKMKNPCAKCDMATKYSKGITGKQHWYLCKANAQQCEKHLQYEKYKESQRKYVKGERLKNSVELPCKIGDTIYRIQEKNKDVLEFEIISSIITDINFSWYSLYEEWIFTLKCKDEFSFCDGDIDKTVFLTKIEACKALDNIIKRTCIGCKYWEEFNEVCCNGESKYCADFVNCGCKHKEINK